MPFKPVDTDIQITFGPLVDSTDFKTLEDAVTYNAAGMYIVIVREWADGSVSVDEVTPAAAGNYTWLHLSQGCYQLQIPASGGASTNNNKTGILYGMGTATGILPFRTPIYDILRQSAYDALTDNSSSSPVVITPSDPGFVTGYYVCYTAGSPATGIVVSLAAIIPPDDGYGVADDADVRTDTSGSDGVVEFAGLLPGQRYRLRRGTVGRWYEFTIPDDADDPYPLNNIIGSP